jgi:asparagine synthase (glutamine-hydrolysing)
LETPLMCGLFGRWGPQSIALHPVLDALHGRGPDDRGEVSWPLAGGWLQLAHTRLAIQDLSAAGHQPMASGDGELQIVFNGEIYNAPELRRDLEQAGLRLRSHSDTEVILEGYGLWGDALWPRLNGIFAVAIVDRRRGELSLARDRFGVKPLLWHRSEGGVAFASELSAFHAAAIPPRPRLDQEALEAFWQWGSVPAPRTLVQGIETFPPGCWARWRAAEPAQGWRIEPFAGLPDALLSPADLSYDEAVRAFRDALQAAVSRQLLADVPVGAFLSGGLDSAAIVALMRRCSNIIPDTFSLGFDQEGRGHRVADERGLARVVAQRCGTNHHELVIGREEAMAAFPEFCQAIDQPSLDGFNTFLVARAARRQGLRVALSGLGGDELLAGYPVFQRGWSFMQAPRTWHSWQAHLPWRLQQRLGWEAARFRRGSVEALASHRQLHRAARGRGETLSLDEAWLLSTAEQQLDPVAQLSRLELRGYMRHTLLRDSDAVTMHQGLELRVPFLDHPLVELLLRLPSAYKIRAGCNKPLLMDAMGDDLPTEILQASKRGFELPFGAWLGAMDEPPLDPAVLGPVWVERIRSARRRFQHQPSCYHGWWQWQVLSRWLAAWPELLPGCG